MNSGIESLNEFIANQAHGVQSRRLESFTLEEMSTIVSGIIGKVGVHVFALSLVQLKRLDLGEENSIRVYKVRRFY